MSTPSIVVPGPFLRWAGGKRQLLPLLRGAMPASLVVPGSSARFFEPFVGGGAVYFDLASQVPGSRCVINDVNPDLLATYRQMQKGVAQLVQELKAQAAKGTTETEFYRVRALAPQNQLERAVRMIYLNRTCFNGLYRVNSKGGFNVPWGKLKNPVVCNEPLLRENAKRLKGTVIREGSFKDAVVDAKAGDFVYFDPPYIPLNPTSSFSRYAKDDFLEPQQRELAETIEDLTQRGVHVMLSNSDTPLTREIFSSLTIYGIHAGRSISAAAGSRNRVGEIIGVNYPESAMVDPKSLRAAVASAIAASAGPAAEEEDSEAE